MNKRFGSIDLLRVLATVAVVTIHSLPNVLSGDLKSGEAGVISAVHGMLNWAVPVFVMITGALMLQRDESIKKTLLRTGRLFSVLLVFGFLMSFLETFFISRDILPSLLRSVKNVFRGETWDVMWYLYMIIGLYLVLPVIRIFVKNADDKTIVYTMAVLFIFNSVIATVNALCGATVMNFDLPMASVYLLYLLAGYYLFHRAKIKINKLLPVSVIILSLIVAILVTMTYGEYSQTKIFFGYNSPVTVLLSLSVFVLIKDKSVNHTAVSRISENSFGIYLIHCFYIHIINKLFHIYPQDFNMFISIPCMVVVVFSLSFVSSWIIRKIPYVKKYI